MNRKRKNKMLCAFCGDEATHGDMCDQCWKALEGEDLEPLDEEVEE